MKKNNKVIDESLILPNKQIALDDAIEYMRYVTSLLQEIYDTQNNFTIQYGNDIRESIDIFVPGNFVKPLPVFFYPWWLLVKWGKGNDGVPC